MSTLSHSHLHDEAAAYKFVEAILWPNGPVCPRCKETKRVGKLNGKSTRLGVYKCYACRKPFTRQGRHDLRGEPHRAAHVAAGDLPDAVSKKGISSNQLHRTLASQLQAPRGSWPSHP